MKSRFIILKLILLISIPVLFGFQNEPDGFRGIKWGEDLKRLKDKGIQLFPSKKSPGNYIIKNDDMSFNGVEVDTILYKFCNNKFHGVYIRFKGFSNCSKMKKILKKTHGKPDKEESSISQAYFGYWGHRDKGYVSMNACGILASTCRGIGWIHIDYGLSVCEKKRKKAINI